MNNIWHQKYRKYKTKYLAFTSNDTSIVTDPSCLIKFIDDYKTYKARHYNIPEQFDYRVNLTGLPDRFYLLSYGSNSIPRFVKKYSMDPVNLSKYSVGLELKGWTRYFFSHNPRWGGSIGSIKRSSSSEDTVQAIAYEIKKTNSQYTIGSESFAFDNLAQQEGMRLDPTDEMINGLGPYILQLIGLYDETPMYAFVRNPRLVELTPLPPGRMYLLAIGVLIRNYREKMFERLDLDYTLTIRYLDDSVPTSSVKLGWRDVDQFVQPP